MERLRGLYAVADDVLLSGRLLPAVRAALQGGCRVVQYRAKQADPQTRLFDANSLLVLCREFGAILLINDDVALVQVTGADGVHLGQDDMPVQDARRLLGPDAIIGATCHDSIDLAEQTEAAGADYVAFGRFFNSTTKPSAPPAPVHVLTRARSRVQCPLVAIGGITLDNASSLVDAGADMLAVVGGLFGHAKSSVADIEMCAKSFTRFYETNRSRETK